MKTAGVFQKIFAAQGTNATAFLDTTSFETAAVTVTGTSTPDGTVTVSAVPNLVDEPTKLVTLFTYATPTATKTYVGPCNGALVFALSGNSTGSVDVEVVLK